MELTRQHLTPVFDNITALLQAEPGQLEAFEPWAVEQALRLRRAAEAGQPNLAMEARLLREELTSMTPLEPERGPTERNERMNLCHRLWLNGLLNFVDTLVSDQQPMVPWAS